MAQKLTPKREKFCLELVKNGGNGALAYQAAGYAVKNRGVANTGANKLQEDEKVMARLAELRAPETKKTIMSIERRREKLTEIAEDEESSKQDAMKAIDLLNKMDALYLQRQEISGAIPVVLNDNVRE